MEEVKKAIAAKTPVIHNDIEYKYITACIMRLKDNQWVYSLELYDKSEHGVTVAKLEAVEVKI